MELRIPTAYRQLWLSKLRLFEPLAARFFVAGFSQGQIEGLFEVTVDQLKVCAAHSRGLHADENLIGSDPDVFQY